MIKAPVGKNLYYETNNLNEFQSKVTKNINMIKSFFEITIGDIARMEETGKVDQFKRWYNPFPIVLFKKRFLKLFKNMYEKLNNKEFEQLDNTVENEYFGKCREELLKLNQLDLLITNHLTNGVKIPVIIAKIKPHLNKKEQAECEKITDKIILNEKNLKYAIEESMKYVLDNSMDTIENIVKFREEIKYRYDRLNMMIQKSKKPEVESDGKKTGIIKYVSSYLSYLGMGFDGIEKVRLSVFLELRDFANEKSEREKEEFEKQKSKI